MGGEQTLLFNSHLENGSRNALMQRTFIGCLLGSKPWKSRFEFQGQGRPFFSLGRGW